VANSVQHVAYELTRGSLSEQEQRLSDLRTRAGTVLEEFHESNAGSLQTLGRWYTSACAALGAEVVLWTLSITGAL
jgi:hypothetical protein